MSDGPKRLLKACQEGNVKKVEILLRIVTNPNIADELGWTPLHYASMLGYKEVVEVLLGAGANPNIADMYGWTPLHRASRNGHKEVVEVLLGAGANPNIADQFGMTPLHYASGNGHKEVVERLLQRGVDPHLADKQGQTPLSLAQNAWTGPHEEVIKMIEAWPKIVSLRTLCMRVIERNQLDRTEYPPLLFYYPDEIEENREERQKR